MGPLHHPGTQRRGGPRRDHGTDLLDLSVPECPRSKRVLRRVNRQLAILGETLYMGTLDAHQIALDARTRRPIWRTEVAKAAEGYAITHAPLIVKNKVIVGTAGGDRGIRGFIAAHDAKTGKELWRFNNIPGPGEPGHDTWSGDSWMKGGAAVWNTGAYDPETNLTYWGSGNPWPDTNGKYGSATICTATVCWLWMRTRAS
jgi:glucose dehydrogenase